MLPQISSYLLGGGGGFSPHQSKLNTKLKKDIKSYAEIILEYVDDTLKLPSKGTIPLPPPPTHCQMILRLLFLVTGPNYQSVRQTDKPQ